MVRRVGTFTGVSTPLETPRRIVKDPSGETKESAPCAQVAALQSPVKVSKGFSGAPPLQITPHVRQVFRFVSPSGATNVGISGNDIIGACGGICTVTNSTFSPWASSFRLHSITIWPGMSSTGYQHGNITFSAAYSAAVEDRMEDMTQPEGSTVSRAVKFVPPKSSLASMFVSGSSSNLFLVTSAPGSIIDVDLEFTLENTFIPNTIAITTGVLGTAYYLPLDGASSHLITPSALPSTH